MNTGYAFLSNLLTGAVWWGVGAALLYYVVRTAVRDGMNQSDLARRLERLAKAPPPAAGRAGGTDGLPDMRAD